MAARQSDSASDTCRQKCPDCNTPAISYRRPCFGPRNDLIGFAHAAHMPRVRRKRPPASSMPRFSRERRRGLKMLADAPRGISEEMLVVVHGFSAQMVAGLVRAGLATVVTETKSAPRGLTITVERIRITDDGKKAIEG